MQPGFDPMAGPVCAVPMYTEIEIPSRCLDSRCRIWPHAGQKKVPKKKKKKNGARVVSHVSGECRSQPLACALLADI